MARCNVTAYSVVSHSLKAKGLEKKRSTQWPYDVVIQRGTSRFLLKITAGPDQNSSILVALFLLDSSPLEEGGRLGGGVLFCF